MNSKTFHKIIQLNKDFYKRVGDEFSNTRQSPWGGWTKILGLMKKQFKDEKKISILDLGCGNGRLYGYLKEELPQYQFNYLGVDSSKLLLTRAKRFYKSSNVKFELNDVILKTQSIQKHYDIVAAFGLTHHIPSKKYREKWFKEISSLVRKNGLFVFTIWDFSKDERFKNLVKSIKTDDVNISVNELEGGDSFLGWQNMKNVYRYFHKYSSDELKTISNILIKSNMKIVVKFYADGKSGNLNCYFIWRKTS